MEIIASTSKDKDGIYRIVIIFHDKDENGEEIEIDLECPPLGTLVCDILNNDYSNSINPVINEFEDWRKDKEYKRIISKEGRRDNIQAQINYCKKLIKKFSTENTESLRNIIDNVFISENNLCTCCSIPERLYYYTYFFDQIEFNAKIRLNGFTNDYLQFSEPLFANSPSKTDLLSFYKEACLKNLDPGSSLAAEFDYELYSCEDLVKCSLLEMSKHNIAVKKCANCGKYFIPLNRSDTIYCDNLAPQDKTKTCKKYGAEKQYQENLKNNEAMGLYRKIYMSKQMLAKRNPDIKDYADSFEIFKTQSKQWKVGIKDNTKTEEEYVEWLKAVKEKKV